MVAIQTAAAWLIHTVSIVCGVYACVRACARTCVCVYARAASARTCLSYINKISLDRFFFLSSWFSTKHVAPDLAWVQGQWFDFEPRTWTTLKVSFQRGSKHSAFLYKLRAFIRISLKCAPPTPKETKGIPQTRQKLQLAWVHSNDRPQDRSWRANILMHWGERTTLPLRRLPRPMVHGRITVDLNISNASLYKAIGNIVQLIVMVRQ